MIIRSNACRCRLRGSDEAITLIVKNLRGQRPYGLLALQYNCDEGAIFSSKCTRNQKQPKSARTCWEQLTTLPEALDLWSKAPGEGG